MSNKTTELCLLLVEGSYGEIPTRIFKTLMLHGRQRISGILQKTDLNLSQIRHGLTVLIKQHLVTWSAGESVSYELNSLAAYDLVRTGKFLKLVGNRFDQQTLQIFAQCLQDGDSYANQLQRAGQGPSDMTNGVNGTSTHQHQESHERIYNLLEHGFMLMTNASHFRSAVDNRERAERRVRLEAPQWTIKVKNAEKIAFERAISEKLTQWTYGGPTIVHAIKNRNLRHLSEPFQQYFEIIEGQPQDDIRPAKIVKTTATDGDAVAYFHEDILVRPNYDKYAILARSNRLKRLAAEKIGVETSQVYAAVLQLIDKDLTNCREFRRDVELEMSDDYVVQPGKTTDEIVKALGDIKGLQSAIGVPGEVNSSMKRKRQKISMDNADEEGQIDDNDEDSDIPTRPHAKTNGKAKPTGPVVNGKGKQRMDIEYDDHDTRTFSSDDELSTTYRYSSVVVDHLKILQEHSLLDYHQKTNNIHGVAEWSIPFNRLSHELRLHEINVTISTQFGASAVRLARILQQNGKLDEKTLISLALIDTKILRAVLLNLHAVGYIELQELPRDNNRAPSKTIYLWYFDESRCAKKMLEDCYQSMSRCLQRLLWEKDQVKELIQKSMRTDVRGNEDEFIVGEESKRLQQWRATEQKLLLEVSRLDDQVLVLRDF